MNPEEIKRVMKKQQAVGKLVLLTGPDFCKSVPGLVGVIDSLENGPKESLRVWMDNPHEPEGHLGYFDHPIYCCGRLIFIPPSRDGTGDLVYFKDPIYTLKINETVNGEVKRELIKEKVDFPKARYHFYTMHMNYGVDNVFVGYNEIVDQIKHFPNYYKVMNEILRRE